MSSLEQQAMIQAVYYPRGKFDHAENTVKLAKAPFNLITIQATDDGVFDHYIVPEQCLYGSGHDVPVQEIAHEREGIGYIVGNVIVEEHSMGAWNNGIVESEYTWKSCFKMGHV